MHAILIIVRAETKKKAGVAGSEGVALAEGVDTGNNNNNNGAILGRSDDWPPAWPGDSRPYFDYLLVVFSGDDQDARKKRDYMREVGNVR